MAAITVTNKVDGVTTSGKRKVAATATGSTSDTFDTKQIGLRRVDKVFKDVTADWVADTAGQTLTLGANQASATYVFEGY